MLVTGDRRVSTSRGAKTSDGREATDTTRDSGVVSGLTALFAYKPDTGRVLADPTDGTSTGNLKHQTMPIGNWKTS